MKLIADTGFVVAFANARDRHHAWAVALAQRMQAPALTCEAVLAEAAFHLHDSGLVLALVEDGMLRIAFDTGEHLGALRSLAKRYRDRRPDLADLCLIRMSELFRQHAVATVDVADFRVYRRNKREVIPTVAPAA
ncbi:MAG: pilus assembly protein [Deltaproteobacteria bacterium]|nr:pilus assembly protein [Deltaproteobacteria bacterium]